jgi:uncharacterized membrane protein
MTTRTIQLPIDVHEDIKRLAEKEAKKLDIHRLSKVDYLRRLIAREKFKLQA